MRSRLPLVPLAMVLALCFSACQDEPEPKIADPTPAPSSTTEATVTTPAPTTEVTSEPPKRETVKQFIKRWQQAAVDMQNTGDSTAFLALSRGCDSCESLAKFVADTYENGGTLEVSEQEVVKLRLAGKVGKVRVFDFELHAGPSLVRNAEGVVTRRLKGGKQKYQVNVVPESHGWLITRASVVEQ